MVGKNQQFSTTAYTKGYLPGKGGNTLIELDVFHDSQQLFYRDPFGAVPCGEKIHLRLRIYTPISEAVCELRFWEEEQEKILLMEKKQRDDIFETDYIAPLEPGVVWYYFRIFVEGKYYYYGNNPENLGGKGQLLSHEPSSYQITVYRKNSVPSWYKEGIMYQIYVDRFFNGYPQGQVYNPKRKSLIHGNWYDKPFYIRDRDGGITRWTFFGGNLEGVIQKLPYLEELGVTILYFNPIFEASSNHKYDTGDYHKIDPMYGDEETLERLAKEARDRGIAIILDGVFSHTGGDSIYFNRYGNYPGLGAYQSEKSIYYSWYSKKDSGEYKYWWGVEDLPEVNELDPSYREFIYGGENSVINYWMKKGIKGWRLDVADELPVEFIRELRRLVQENNPEAVIIGEVWEDASRKVSYDELRQYFSGNLLDSTMNYPWRLIMVNFLLEEISAQEALERLMSLYENYPLENFRAAMNLIGSHDRIRILTLLGEAPPPDNLAEEEKENFTLEIEARKRGIGRLKILALMQITFPGVPCIYYGDEVGVEGFDDPFNRGTYPWGKEDGELLSWYKRLIELRKEYALFTKGHLEIFCHGQEVLGFRVKDEEEEIIVMINRSLNKNIAIEIPGKGDLVLDLLAGEKIITEDKNIIVTLDSLSGKVFYSTKKKHSNPLDRSCGVLMPITSLSSPWGIGDLGLPAKDFADFLEFSGHSLWQILPLNPLGLGNSPYQSSSVFAGNTLLISIDSLLGQGLITEGEIKKVLEIGKEDKVHKINYQLVKKIKEPLLKKAFQRFQRLPVNKKGRYFQFIEENNYWLKDYALYQVLKEQNTNKPWQQWEEPLAQRERETLALIKRYHREELEYQCFLQYIFFSQWQELKEYANDKGIKIIGDLPIYIAGDSSDTWANRELFLLDEEGKFSTVAGVPPDYFNEDGQLWGNPLYNWGKMEKDNFFWWKKRLKQALELYDWLRLDHFRGFAGYWAVNSSERTAVKGRWLKGPGLKFFRELEKELGHLPIMAEDLGHITPEVNNLRNILGFPGMLVYQFTPLDEKLTPNLSRTIFYSGTHDNNTLLGWVLEKGKAALSIKESREKVEDILKSIYQCEAPWVIFPMQDLLGLGQEARTNTPGTVEGNWLWQMEKNTLSDELALWMKKQAIESKRLRNS